MNRLILSLALLLIHALPAFAQEPITFTNQIVRIFQRNCQTCHRPGNIAPFSLMTYEETLPYISRIRRAVSTRQMPPWKPVHAGVFRNERLLSGEDIQMIVSWADAGAPEGVPVDLPDAVAFPETWSLGEPDLVLQPPDFYKLDLAKTDIYRCFSLPVDETEDVWVRGLEVAPEVRSVVHHVLLFVDTGSTSMRLDNDDPDSGYSCFGGPGFSPQSGLGGWAPGMQAQFFPDGVGVRVPAGARVVMQVHYNLLGHIGHESTSAGLPVQDRTRVGLFLSPEPPARSLLWLPVLNTRFTIPPGDPHHEVRGSILLPIGMHLVSIAPHMHLLGREMKVEMIPLNGDRKTLVEINDWDFNWQENYIYNEPVALSAGSRIQLTAYYDNSSENPRNPSYPPIPVGWGERTIDEMCLCFLGVTIDNPFLAGLFR